LGPIAIILLMLGSSALGVILVHFFPLLKRAFAGNNLLELRVAQRAAQAFINEEVFATRDRTGILLFLSLFEHKVIVVGDSGINAKVHQTEWSDVVDRVVRGINAGRSAEGLIDAIHQCGTLLKMHGVKRRSDDTNELSNRLRMGSSKQKPKRRNRR
jgi:putative membrane protein